MKKSKIKKIIVDESVSQDISDDFIVYLKNKNIKNLETYFIKDQHKSIPDILIFTADFVKRFN